MRKLWLLLNAVSYIQLACKLCWRWFNEEVVLYNKGYSSKWVYWDSSIAWYIVANLLFFFFAKKTSIVNQKQRLFFLILAFSDLVKILFLSIEHYQINDYVFVGIAGSVALTYKAKGE